MKNFVINKMSKSVFVITIIIFLVMIAVAIVTYYGMQYADNYTKEFPNPKDLKLAVITRCKDEKYIKEFCDYYLSIGADNIIIMDDNTVDTSIFNGLDPKVHIYPNTMNLYHMDALQNVYEQIRGKYNWLLHVDADEFVFCQRDIKNLLNTKYRNVGCVMIPWVIMSCNGRKKNPKSILLSITHRWDHDKKHPYKRENASEYARSKFNCMYKNIEIKSLFQPKFYNKITEHIPENPLNVFAQTVDSVKNRFYRKPTYRIPAFREKQMKKADFICFHYRLISEEQAVHKVNTSEIYQRKQITPEDILSFDYPEKYEERLRNHALNVMHYKN